MLISLKKLNPTMKFNFFDDDPSQGGMELRVPPRSVLDEITEQVTKPETKTIKGSFFPSTKTDKDLEAQLMYDYQIVDWWGIVDVDTGEEIPCTKENKFKLCYGNPYLSRWVGEKIMKMREMFPQEEELEKNLKKQSKGKQE